MQPKNDKFQKIVDEVLKWCRDTAGSILEDNKLDRAIELAVRKAFKRKCMGTCDSFLQAEMIINDIKKVTGCKSDDGVEIVESVENLRKETTQKIIEEVEKYNCFYKGEKLGKVDTVMICVYCFNELKSRFGYICNCQCHDVPGFCHCFDKGCCNLKKGDEG